MAYRSQSNRRVPAKTKHHKLTTLKGRTSVSPTVQVSYSAANGERETRLSQPGNVRVLVKNLNREGVDSQSKVASDLRDQILREITKTLEETPDEELIAVDAGSAEVTVGRLYAAKRLSNEWGDAIGPFYDDEGLLRWLPELTQPDLDEAVERREILVVHAGQTALYPTFQFDSSGQPLPGLSQVLQILERGLASPWDQGLWLKGPVGRLTGRTGVELLRLGRLDIVLSEATDDIIGMTA